jgi:hypothetical protein
MDTFTQLCLIRDQLQSDLSELPTYRRLQAVEAAIAEFVGSKEPAGGISGDKPQRVSINAPIIDAVERELQRRGTWMRSTELARILESQGMKLRTKNTAPQSHLAAILSSKITKGRIVHKYKRGYGLPRWLKEPPVAVN